MTELSRVPWGLFLQQVITAQTSIFNFIDFLNCVIPVHVQ